MRITKSTKTAVAVLLLIPILGACGKSASDKAGETTCAEFIKMTPDHREQIIKTMDPTATTKQHHSAEKWLFTVCSDPNKSDPSGRLEDISP